MNASYTGSEWLGLAMLLGGVIWSNLAVSKMAKTMRLAWNVGYKSLEADRRSRRVVHEYRIRYGNSPLFWNLVMAYGSAGVGLLLFIFGRFGL